MNQKGQALIILLVAIALALTILTAAITSSIVQGKNTSRNILGRRVYYAAETGAEYALMKMMRTPGSCSGTDNLTFGSANINILYSTSGPNCVISSTAQEGDLIKKITVESSYDGNQIYNYCCWTENP